MLVILIGNKLDLKSKRVIPSEQAAKFAEKYNMPYIETSGLDGSNVNAAFETLVKGLNKN
jgi:GTPase SAR1 family protein